VLAAAWDTSAGALCFSVVRLAEKADGPDRDRAEAPGDSPDETPDEDRGFGPRFRTLFSLSVRAAESHSRLLPSVLREALDKLGLEPRDLDLVAAGRGPGSFTGLRAGLAFAKGFAMGAGIPAIGVPSLAALAFAPNPAPALVVPVADARRGELFACLYEVGEVEKVGAPAENPETRRDRFWEIPLPRALTPVLAIKPQNFPGTMKETILGLKGREPGPDLPLTVLGEDSRLLPQGLPEGFATNPLPADPAAFGALGLRLLASGNPGDNPPLPLYGRSPEIFKTWKPPARLSDSR
jgi:tRNA threonylcarbamoyl adenosine modification protein YeaZ